MSIQWKLKVVHCTPNKLKLIFVPRATLSHFMYICVCGGGGGGGGGMCVCGGVRGGDLRGLCVLVD